MATRSTIAQEQANGKVMQIYCHWDGYLDNNGRILDAHWSDPVKVYALMLLGDISSLRTQVGQAHDFDARYEDADERNEWCVAYGRDRGEKGTDARVFKDYEHYKKDHQYEEYEYIQRKNGEWYVSQYGRAYEPLAAALAGQAVLADE